MELIPVLCGSSFKNKGVQLLLDAICDYLPSPIDLPPVTGINPRTGEEEQLGLLMTSHSRVSLQDLTRSICGQADLFGSTQELSKLVIYVYNVTRDRRSVSGASCGCH